MAQAKYDEFRRAFVLEDGSLIENLEIIGCNVSQDSTPIYEIGKATPVDYAQGFKTTTITVDYQEPEGFSLAEDIKGWRTEVNKEEVRKKSEEIVNDFKR